MEQQLTISAATMDPPLMKYKVRSEAIDLGKTYEFKMVAWICLRCVLSKEDMWISSNADGVGAFDDVVFRLGDTTFMLQLKHKSEPKPLQEREFLAPPKGDFSLLKYIYDIDKLKHCIDSKSKKSEIINYLSAFNEIYFVLFTNRNVKPCSFLEKSCNNVLTFLDTSNDSNVHKIHLSKLPETVDLDNLNYNNNVYLFANQIHAKSIDLKIMKEIEKIAEKFCLMEKDVKDVADNFIKFVELWARGLLGGYYCLTKQDVLSKLSELFFRQSEIKLDREKFTFYDDKQKCIWNEIIQDKTVTVVDFEENILNFLFEYVGSKVKVFCKISKNSWAQHLSDEEKNSFYENHPQLKKFMLKIAGNHGKINLLDVYKCLWMNNEVPLLLEINKVCQYHDVLNILKLSNYSRRIIIVNKSRELIKFEEKVNHFETMQQLCEEERNKILNQTVRFQGRPIKLECLIDENMFHYIKCRHIINILLSDFHIGNNLNELPYYFIHRKISRIFLPMEVLEKVQNEIFLIKEIIQESLTMLLPKKIKVQCLTDVDFNYLNDCHVIIYREKVTQEQIEKLISSKKIIHSVSIHDSNYLEWKVSFGSIKNLKQFYVELKDVTESKIKDKFSYPANVISASPGMGKSVLMDFIALQAPTNKWVLRIDLNGHQHYYKNKNCKVSKESSKHLEYFKNALLNQSKCNTELNTAIFQKFAQTKDVIVLLDGFDEVLPSYKAEIMNIAKSLHKEGFGIWLTTRPHLKSYLEEEFDAFSITLSPFSKEDQKEFLTKYFTITTGLKDISDTLVNSFVDKLIEAAKKNLNDKDAEFTGIPLQTKLLGGAFEDDCKKYLSSSNVREFNTNFDLLYLYEKFIDKKIEIFSEKFGIAADIVHRMFEKHHSLLAIDLLFPMRGDLSEDFKQQWNDCCTDNSTIQDLQKEGLVTVDENFNVNFVHRTFGEYFAALWLSENFNSSNEKLKEIAKTLIKERFSGNYKFLFNIFDRILCKKCCLHMAVINNRTDEALRIIFTDVDQVTTVDACGRSILHILALYGVQFPQLFISRSSLTSESRDFLELEEFEKDIMMHILEKIQIDKLPDFKADLLGFSPLDYAVASRCLNIAEKICTKLKISNINTNISLNWKEDYLGYCAVLGYKSLLNVFLEYFAFADVLHRKVKYKTQDKACFSIIENYNHYFQSVFENIRAYDNGKDWKHISVIKTYKVEAKSKYGISEWNNSCHYTLNHAIVFDSKQEINKLVLKETQINKQDGSYNTPLHYAALCNQPEIVGILLSKGAKVNRQNIHGDTPLHFAVARDARYQNESNFEESCSIIVRMLLSNGSKINLQNFKGFTPLHLALHNKKNSLSQLFISNCANLNLEDNEGKNILHFAVINDNCDILNNILVRGVDINKRDNYGRTPLFLSVLGNNLDIVKLLISNGANVNLGNKEGKNVLHLAAKNGNNDVLLEILSQVPDINKQDYDGWTPLFYAVAYNRLETVKLLICNGANVSLENTEGTNILHVAAKKGNNDILNEILCRGLDINSKNRDGWTPLFYAVHHKRLDTTKLLISNGAIVNLKNRNEVHILHIAAKNGNSAIVSELLNNGADINTQDSNGWTPLFCAVRYYSVDTAKLLIFNGANIHIESEDKKNVLHIAAMEGNDYISEEILCKGVNIDKQDIYGWTPLFYAIRYDHLSTVRLLISSGANINLQNKAGKNVIQVAAETRDTDILVEIFNELDADKEADDKWTPLFYAVSCNQPEIVKLLLSRDAKTYTEDAKGRNILHLAAKTGNNDILNHIFCKDIDTNKQDNDGWTPLFYAAFYDRLDTLKLLISQGANISLEDRDGANILHFAAQNSNNDILSEILYKAANIDKPNNNNGWTALFYAVIFNRLENVKLLISSGANISLKSKEGTNVVHFAAKEGNNEILNELLHKDADVDEPDNNGWTPLFYAVIYNRLKTVKLLISNDANIKLKGKSGENVVHFAAKEGNNDILNELLYHGAHPNQHDNNGFIPLFYAAIYNRLDTLKLLSNGISMKLKNKGKNVLHFAAKEGNNDIISELLCRGMDIDNQDNEGWTSLFYAVHYNHLGTVKLLLSNGADINLINKEGENILQYAAKTGFTEALTEIFKILDVDKQATDGWTPLFYAAYYNHLAILKLLVSSGTSINLKDTNGRNVVHFAAKRGNDNILNEVLQRGIHIDSQDNNGWSPLFYAVFYNRVDTVNILISSGANVNLENNEGKTVLHLAARNGIQDILCKLMLCRNININKQDNYKRTPLFYAVFYNHLDAVKLLIQKGSNPNIKNNNDETVLEVARKRKYNSIIDMLSNKKNRETACAIT